MSGREPDFLIPGASKSGTTSLFYYLDEHDEVFLPDTKELHFFDRDSAYSRGLDYYEGQFTDAGPRKVAGEITPSYFYAGKRYAEESYKSFIWDTEDDVPARIRDAYPDTKLVFTLRNPIDRAHSQFWKNYRQGRERADSLGEAVREELDDERDHRETAMCWVYNNRYTTHLRRWFECFERDQLRVFIFEEWIQDPDETLDEICEFLGVEPLGSWSRSNERRNVGGTPRFVGLNRFYQDYLQGTPLGALLQRSRVTHVFDALNSSQGYPNLSASERKLLSDVFKPEVEALEDLLGSDLDVWREEFVS